MDGKLIGGKDVLVPPNQTATVPFIWIAERGTHPLSYAILDEKNTTLASGREIMTVGPRAAPLQGEISEDS